MLAHIIEKVEGTRQLQAQLDSGTLVVIRTCLSLSLSLSLILTLSLHWLHFKAPHSDKLLFLSN